MPKRPLYLMAKPPLDIARRIHGLPLSDRKRPAHLSHMTLAAFADLAEVPARFLQSVVDLLEDFSASAFRVAFNRIDNGGTVSLRNSRSLSAVRDFQSQLAAHLRRRSFPLFTMPSTPHVTINYRGDGLGRQPIDPIGWTVEQIVLIESVTGETRHVDHGNWRLVGPLQLSLF